MIAVRYDIGPVLQGQTVDEPIQWVDEATGLPYNLAGWGARMQVRAAPDAAVLLDLSSPSALFVEAAAGTVYVRLTPAQTAALPRADLVYDLYLISPSGGREPLVYGQIVVRASITQF